MNTLTIKYIDHSMCNTSELLQFKNIAKILTNKYKHNPNICVLHTCHRIEIISVNDFIDDFYVGDISSNAIETHDESLYRIMSIYIGIESVILGDEFVIKQMDNALEPFMYLLKPYRELALHIKDKNEFSNSKNYIDIISERINSSDILMVGSGMIITNLIKNVINKNITLVTRDIKQAKKAVNKLQHTNNIQYCILNDLLLDDKCETCVIATNLNDDYKNKLKPLITNTRIIDFSDKPLYENVYPSTYLNMYNKQFEKIAKNVNSELIHKIDDIKQQIWKSLKTQIYV